jgi:hypothetical protein
MSKRRLHAKAAIIIPSARCEWMDWLPHINEWTNTVQAEVWFDHTDARTDSVERIARRSA